ncbi:MAG: hypothetical protein WCQ87_05780 [Parabacteroides sp.]
MKKLLIIFLLLVSCEKDEAPAFSTVRVKYDIEGTYEGISILDCPGFGCYHKERKNTIVITAFDAETVGISTMRTNASANVNKAQYRYNTFYWIGTNDCGRHMNVSYTGTGIIKGDSLIENGTAIVNGYQATWQTRSIKINN